MKNFSILLILFSGLFFYNCQAQTNKPPVVNRFGKAFTSQNSIAAKDLTNMLGNKDSLAIKVTGQVLDVCQAKGCWMDVKLKDNSVMKVRFKDYAFFVPKDVKGKTVVINGMAYNTNLSVAEQRHYAQDAGKTKAEVNAISEPIKRITFTADGVLVK